ncbi:MAG: hypothetical protein IPO94_16195 [Saprospiraceae bacterium]|nr:hypothetical protein [Saprospiraceae bacterium]
MKNNILKYLVNLLVFCWLILPAYGQNEDVINYSDKKTYEIVEMSNITGAETRDRNAIKSIANLKEGNKIQIPGPAIPAAIKALLKLRLFDDVQIFQES